MGLYFMDGTTQASQLFLGMFAAGVQFLFVFLLSEFSAPVL